MSRFVLIAAAILSAGLLLMSPFAFEEIRWRSWSYHPANSIFLSLLILSPASCLLLCYFALRENLVSLIQLTLQRRKLEANRAVLQAQADILALSTSQPNRQQMANEFVRLWTAAGSAPSYDKDAWKSVERQLLEVGAI